MCDSHYKLLSYDRVQFLSRLVPETGEHKTPKCDIILGGFLYSGDKSKLINYISINFDVFWCFISYLLLTSCEWVLLSGLAHTHCLPCRYQQSPRQTRKLVPETWIGRNTCFRSKSIVSEGDRWVGVIRPKATRLLGTRQLLHWYSVSVRYSRCDSRALCLAPIETTKL